MSVPAKNDLYNALEALKGQLSKIRAIETSPMKTGGMFSYTPNTQANSINIHKCQDLQTLIEIAAFILMKAANYATAAKTLGVGTYPVFSWMNHSEEAWLNDLRIQVSVVTSHNSKKELTEEIKDLEEFLGKEDRLAIKLKQLADKGLIPSSEEGAQ